MNAEIFKKQYRVQGLGKNTDEILLTYEAMNVRLEKLKTHYEAEVDCGTKRKELEKWNQYVVDNLGIDNMRSFNLTE